MADPPWGSGVVERPVSAGNITDTPWFAIPLYAPLELPFAYQYCCPMQTIYAREPMGVRSHLACDENRLSLAPGSNFSPLMSARDNGTIYVDNKLPRLTIKYQTHYRAENIRHLNYYTHI